ncbi:GGDEF domain-containing protein, partial [Acinetobacter baumannii]
MDLDNFKPINDQFGHEAGDEVLRAVGRRLQRALRQDDVVARFGGDEFVALLNDVRSPTDIDLIKKKIQRAFGQPIN